MPDKNAGFLILLSWYVYAWQHFLPSAVIHGFTLGVALIIMGGQLGSSLGLNNLEPKANWFLNLYEVFSHVQETSAQALLLFAGAWTFLFFLVRRQPRVPWSVPIAAAGIGLGSECIASFLLCNIPRT